MKENRMGKDYSIHELQECILSVMKDVDRFCKKNKIQYYLMGGSALGAMRHRGFIPWDDDLDIFMTYDNYQKFIKDFGQFIKENQDYTKYYLQVENTEEWPLFLCRVCLKGTTMISNEFKYNMKQHHTVFVDVMCLYSVPDMRIKQCLHYISAKLLRVNALARCHFTNRNVIKRMALNISKFIVNPLTKPLLIKYLRRYETKKTGYVGHYFGRARFKKAVFPRSYLGVPRYVPFEDAEFPVFERVEDYLASRYGPAWMKMPDQTVKNQYPIHGDFVDLSRDYTEYMSPDHLEWTI